MVISKHPLRFILTVVIACLPLFSFANIVLDSTKVHTEAVHSVVAIKEALNEQNIEPTDVKSKIKEFINHHLLDAHDFTLSVNEETGEHYGFSLPIILWDNGLQVFSSSEFHYGKKTAEHNGNFYVLHHEKIYKTEANGELTEGKNGFPTNVRPIDFSITKSVIGIMLVALFMFLLFGGLAKTYSKNNGIAISSRTYKTSGSKIRPAPEAIPLFLE